ncbi:MAG: nuclear transport factor 2 family protein [Actinomycetota bacterium]|nr:nuclear transport factor 2 family protein [Actinomycetota bacterium]
MSQKNLIVLAQLAEAFNEEGWEGTLPFLHADLEFHEPPEQPGATVFHGREAARRGWARWAESWTEQHSEVQGFRELPDGRVLTFSHQRMRGRDGIEVEQDAWNLFTVQGGKVLRWESYWEESNALEAAGLRE